MRAVLEYEVGVGYLVNMYITLPTDKYPRYHTLRAFECEGEARLFQNYINNHGIQYDILLQFIKSYDPKRIVTQVKRIGDGRPTLTTKTISI